MQTVPLDKVEKLEPAIVAPAVWVEQPQLGARAEWKDGSVEWNLFDWIGLSIFVSLYYSLLSFTKVGLQNTSEYAGAADGGVATPAFDGRPTRRATYGSGAALPHRRIQ
jgi:hypothetical protein